MDGEHNEVNQTLARQLNKSVVPIFTNRISGYKILGMLFYFILHFRDSWD